MGSRFDFRLDRIEEQLAPDESPVAFFSGSAAEIEEQRKAWIEAHGGREPRMSYMVEH